MSFHEPAGRALTKAESALIRWLLRPDFPGATALRKQLPKTRALGTWHPDWVSLNLSVAQDAAASEFADGPVPGEVWAYDTDGHPTGTVVLWVSDGYLSAVEYGWVTDEPPTALPTTDALRDIAAGSTHKEHDAARRRKPGILP